jgi:hypothetical protein
MAAAVSLVRRRTRWLDRSRTERPRPRWPCSAFTRKQKRPNPDLDNLNFRNARDMVATGGDDH